MQTGNLIAAGNPWAARQQSDRKVTLLTNQGGGQPVRYADARGGREVSKVYFTDASGRFSPRSGAAPSDATVLDILETSGDRPVSSMSPAAGPPASLQRPQLWPMGLRSAAMSAPLFSPKPVDIRLGRSPQPPKISR